MTVTTQGTILPQLALGDTFPPSLIPLSDKQEASDHLYISLSRLIKETIAYHPELSRDLSALSQEDKQKLCALLNSDSVTEGDVKQHFVATLVKLIKEASTHNGKQYSHIRIALSDADSNAYSALLGGECEENETNPAMGLRGVSRFASKNHSYAFELECEVIKSLRTEGVDVEIVVPFVRALSDAAKIIDRLAEQGLPRGLNGLKVLFCGDTPASVLLSDKLLQYFDGLVINVDNLAQLSLGIDRTNPALDYLYDLQHEAVLLLIQQATKASQNANKPCVIYCQSLTPFPKLQDRIAELGEIELIALA